jgi:hypothetical protein
MTSLGAAASVRVPVYPPVSALFHQLDRLGFLDQDAGLSAWPTPTMTDIGVASPSAHGQAIISTATALTIAWAARLRSMNHQMKM